MSQGKKNTAPAKAAPPLAPSAVHALREAVWKHALLVMSQQPKGEASTAELIARLPDLISIPEEANASNAGRKDTKFSQMVRNLKSHRHTATSFIRQGYAQSIPGGFRVTEKGTRFVRRHCKARSLRTRRSVPEDFEVILVEKGRPGCESWYRAKRSTVTRWLEEVGKGRLIARRAAYVRSRRRRSSPKYAKHAADETVCDRESGQHAVPFPLARLAAQFLRSHADSGAHSVSLSPQGDWRMGDRRLSSSALVAMATQRGFVAEVSTVPDIRTAGQKTPASSRRPGTGKPGVPPWQPAPEDLARIRHCAGLGSTQEQVASMVGVSVDTLVRCRDAKAAFESAKAEAITAVAGALYRKAMDGDTTSMIFYLKTQAGWRETERRELTGPDGAPIQYMGRVVADAKEFTERITRVAARKAADRGAGTA